MALSSHTTKSSPYGPLHANASTSTLSLTSHDNDPCDRLHQTDLEHDGDSETTLHEDSEGFLSKRSNLALRNSRIQTILTWFRWGTIIFFQGIIVMMLLLTSGFLGDGLGLSGLLGGEKGNSNGDIVKAGRTLPIDTKVGGAWSAGKTETGGDVNGLYVPLSHAYKLLTQEEENFVPNMTDNSNRMEIRHNWDMLMPLGSGSVSIPDYRSHPMLGQPIEDDPIRSGPLFEASWTHALHCLYYSVDSYHQIITSNGTRFGFDKERNDYHAAHCFEYLRNSILCMADMTLEGDSSNILSGMGQAHMCRNREEAVQWIEERRVDDLQSIIGPN